MATPIGNLGDITLRALETLAGVDIIACEDTRMTHRLTERYGITATLKPYHEHNAAQARPKILQKLAQGGSIALVSDAGTPLISDPGYKLVREVCAAGHAVIRCPARPRCWRRWRWRRCRPTGSTSKAFCRRKQGARRARLAELARIDATLVMFESGNRVQETLRDLAGVMGSREAAICRELTKLHEEVRRAGVGAGRRPPTLETRGEFVLVIGPPVAGAQIMAERCAGRAAAHVAAARQRQGRGGACGRTVRPAAPRDLCPRAGTGQGDPRRRTMAKPDQRETEAGARIKPPPPRGSRPSTLGCRPRPAPTRFCRSTAIGSWRGGFAPAMARSTSSPRRSAGCLRRGQGARPDR